MSHGVLEHRSGAADGADHGGRVIPCDAVSSSGTGPIRVAVNGVVLLLPADHKAPRMAREAGGRTPNTARIDEVLDERSGCKPFPV
jgi:hypothetical protein